MRSVPPPKPSLSLRLRAEAALWGKEEAARALMLEAASALGDAERKLAELQAVVKRLTPP